MGEVIGHVLQGILHALIGIADWIPQSRWNSIREEWAWPIAACLAVGFIALIAALCLGHPGLYLLFIGASTGAFGFVCLGAFCSRPRRGG